MLTAKVILLKNMRSETQRYTTSMRKGCFFSSDKVYYLEINCDDSK